MAASHRPDGPAHAGARPGPDDLAIARRLFETTLAPLTAIGRQTGLSPRRLKRQARLGGWRRPDRSAGIARAADGAGAVCPGIALCPVRAAMHRRVYDLLLLRLERAEGAGAALSLADRERDIRGLASLTRALDRLAAMDRAAAAAAVAPAAAEDKAPYDVETLRRELSEKLERLARSRRPR